MNKIKVKVKKVRENAILPLYANLYAAGADLYACIDASETIAPGQSKMIPTGIALEMPDDFAAYVCARSGLACKSGLAPANKIGVIDPDYRGEIMICLHNHSDKPATIHNGDRIAQLVFLQRFLATFIEVDELSETDRGGSGFGSTGK